MKITLSREAMEGLPDPDAQGIIRTSAALKLTADGMAELMEINDSPVGSDKRSDDDAPMPEEDLPDPNRTPLF